MKRAIDIYNDAMKEYEDYLKKSTGQSSIEMDNIYLNQLLEEDELSDDDFLSKCRRAENCDECQYRTIMDCPGDYHEN